MLHALLLGGWPDGASLKPATELARADGATPMWARQIVSARPAPAPSPLQPPAISAVAPAPVAPGADAAAARRNSRVTTGPESSEFVDTPVAASSAERALQEAAAPTAATAASTASAPASASVTVTADTTPVAASDGAALLTLPVYRTQPAPPATLLFELKRGLARGQAVLQWRPDRQDASYVLTLQAQAFGVSVAAWNSSGRFDAAGLAPQRYAELRRNREVRATNFQRAAQKISFSAQSTEFELTPGVQDRSSWMLQLGAVLQANPELALPGAQVTLVVVGTRGAPEPWVFTVVDRAGLTLTAGESPITLADAVQLLREPRRPYDTRVRVWLDPSRHHLPVKVQMLVQATGEGQEFELQQMSLP